MNVEQVTALMTALGLGVQPSKRHGWVTASCPFAEWRHEAGTDNHPSFGIRVATSKKTTRAYCLSCGYTADMGELIVDMRGRYTGDPGVNFKEAMALVSSADDDGGGAEGIGALGEGAEDVEEHLFPEVWLASFPHAWDYPDAKKYLKSRRVDRDTCEAMSFRWDATRRRVAVPVRDFDGVLRGLHGRAVDDDVGLPYLMYTHNGHTNPHVWWGEDTVDMDAPVLVTESVFDRTACHPVYPNILCPLRATIDHHKLVRLKGASEVITCMDNDVAGQKAVGVVAQACAKWGVPFSNIKPPKGKDPGALVDWEVDALLSSLAKKGVLHPGW